jgi:hypothetical protein
MVAFQKQPVRGYENFVAHPFLKKHFFSVIFVPVSFENSCVVGWVLSSGKGFSVRCVVQNLPLIMSAAVAVITILPKIFSMKREA